MLQHTVSRLYHKNIKNSVSDFAQPKTALRHLGQTGFADLWASKQECRLITHITQEKLDRTTGLHLVSYGQRFVCVASISAGLIFLPLVQHSNTEVKEQNGIPWPRIRKHGPEWDGKGQV